MSNLDINDGGEVIWIILMLEFKIMISIQFKILEKIKK